MSNRQKRSNLIALSVGVLCTILTVIVFETSWLQRIEWITLDFRFQFASPIRESDKIVCVMIDDKSIDRVGRWPWSRTDQAELIAIPAEFGARAILVDLTWSESEPLRLSTQADDDILADPTNVELDEILVERPDLTLSLAIAAANNVYLNFDFNEAPSLSSDEMREAVDARLAGDDAGALRACERLRRRAADLVLRRPEEERKVRWTEHALAYARLIAAIQLDPAATSDQYAADSRFQEVLRDPGEFDKARIIAYRRLVERHIADNPQATTSPSRLFETLFEEISGAASVRESPRRAALALAIRHVLGERYTLMPWLVELSRIGPAATMAGSITPVYFRHAAVARRCGFVNFEPDADGTVRRVPLLVQHHGRLVPQIALAVACDELGITGDQIDLRRDGRVLTLGDESTPGGMRRIEIDAAGRAIVPWTSTADWTQSFAQVPAESLIELARSRERIRNNENEILDALARALADPSLASLADRAKLLRDVRDARTEYVKARAVGEKEVAEIMAQAIEEHRPELDALREQVLRVADATDASPVVRDSAATIRVAEDASERMTRDIAAASAMLRSRFAGRLCMIGYAATSLADLKPTPTSRSAPGVLAHANLLNGILNNQLVSKVSVWVNATLAILGGVLMSMAGVFLRPRVSIVVLLVSTATYVAIVGGLLFYQSLLWVGLTNALTAMLLSYFAVASYRFIFIDSERRQLSTALGQYTSKEIARQVADNADLCRRAEMREVTSVFTDLKGFTTISEKIGAERTQKVLNVCLGRFTDVLLRHEAMVNKFIGDGIFAFWNPVIYPQADHAMRACESAIDLIAALKVLRETQARGGDEIFSELWLRVGVATGNAIVGPCGSEQKYDYTCIGDSVNTAARLESANKFYGTSILIAGPTRVQVGDAFELRALGGVRVKGKNQAVQIFELLGRRGHVADADLDYAAEFGRAVEWFQQRDFERAKAAFEKMHALRPEDAAAAEYAEAALASYLSPPPTDWNGALELQEK
ncbi:MAG: CHASE2 domain-containing protein [Phycisphaerae bacterium]